MEIRCGNLVMQYIDGFLRSILSGDTEIINRIYFAVRDKNWETIRGDIKNENADIDEEAFHISYEYEIHFRDIHMHWRVAIDGNSAGVILFEIEGEALSDFQKNRLGFCVLHPIKSCAGKSVTIMHTDGSNEQNTFPYYISPHQPFTDIAAMQWKPVPEISATIQFTGDVFETEDHRNWTDNNYKTYCTPLALPFPCTLHAGDKIRQTIKLTVECSKITPVHVNDIVVTAMDEIIPIPSIGIARASERNSGYDASLKYLSRTGFSHYRADIKLSDKYWEQTLQEVLLESNWINAPLEIALFLNNNSDKEIDQFIRAIKNPSPVKQIILIEENVKCIDNLLLQNAYKKIKGHFNDILIGGGTDFNFAEINRSDIDSTAIDFVSFSINPQVHAVDDCSLIENLEGQAFTVETALYKFKKQVHVSPVTLKSRFNPDATEKTRNNLPPADKRQSTVFSATWTVGSLKYLIESGASSITYFETVGTRGLMEDTAPFKPFPLLEIFKIICDNRITEVIKSISSHTGVCTSLIIGNKKKRFLLLANHTTQEIRVRIEKLYASLTLLQVKAGEVLLIDYKKTIPEPG